MISRKKFWRDDPAGHTRTASPKDNAPPVAAGEALKVVTQTSKERGNRMKSTTLSLSRQSAVILFHPNHDAPPVENPRVRGPKKGCVNFMKWQREREYRRFAAQEAELASYRAQRSAMTA